MKGTNPGDDVRVVQDFLAKLIVSAARSSVPLYQRDGDWHCCCCCCDPFEHHQSVALFAHRHGHDEPCGAQTATPPSQTSCWDLVGPYEGRIPSTLSLLHWEKQT